MFSEYSIHEVRSTFRMRHVAVLAGCMLGSVGVSYLLPTMPETIYRFFKKVFALDNWTEIILINDLTGVFFALFWAGAIDLLRVYTLPKEEGYLELLLSKPLGRMQYLRVRMLPILAVIGAMGLILSFFLPLKIALINGSDDLDLLAVICAGIVTTALTLMLLALLNLLFLFSGETYYAVLLAFILLSIVIIPLAVFMYRPDLFIGKTLLRDIVVFPGNLLWLSGSLPRLTPILLLAATAIVILLLSGGGRRLNRMDIS